MGFSIQGDYFKTLHSLQAFYPLYQNAVNASRNYSWEDHEENYFQIGGGGGGSVINSL